MTDAPAFVSVRVAARALGYSDRYVRMLAPEIAGAVRTRRAWSIPIVWLDGLLEAREAELAAYGGVCPTCGHRPAEAEVETEATEHDTSHDSLR